MPKTPTPKQLAANRANAARSTGPRTPEGKSASAQNARKHGFTGSTFAVVRLEDLTELDNLRADLIDFYQPANSEELFCLERMALARHHLLRCARLESGIFTACMNHALDRDDHPFRPMSEDLVCGDLPTTQTQNRNYALAQGFEFMAAHNDTWKLFLRYQAQNERLYRRALEDYQRARALRNEPNPTPQPQQTKQTPALGNKPDSTTPAPGPRTLAPGATAPGREAPSASLRESVSPPASPKGLPSCAPVALRRFPDNRIS